MCLDQLPTAYEDKRTRFRLDRHSCVGVHEEIKGNTDMICYFETMAAFAVISLATQSRAEFFKATFISNKTVSTRYLQVTPMSKLQCVEKCYTEGKHGRCVIAGYTNATQSCHLSMDSQQDVVDVPDESVGVFIYQQQQLDETQGTKCISDDHATETYFLTAYSAFVTPYEIKVIHL